MKNVAESFVLGESMLLTVCQFLCYAGRENKADDGISIIKKEEGRADV